MHTWVTSAAGTARLRVLSEFSPFSLKYTGHCCTSCTDVMLDLRAPLGVAPAALQGAAAAAARVGTSTAASMATPEPMRPGDRCVSMDSLGSPSKHAISRPSPQFLSYRRFCRERTFGMLSESSARLKVWGFHSQVETSTHLAFSEVRNATQLPCWSSRLNRYIFMLQVSSVDFRRIWLDKDSKEPSREGIGIWRPVPPPGYYALGKL